MNYKVVVSRLFSLLMVTIVGGLLALPAAAQDSHVTVASQRSFDQTVSQLKSSISQGGMMVMAEVNQGNMLAMTGLKLKATLFLVGNPNCRQEDLRAGPCRRSLHSAACFCLRGQGRQNLFELRQAEFTAWTAQQPGHQHDCGHAGPET